MEIETSTVEIEERGVKLKLTVVDTPGFGDSLDNSEWYENYCDKTRKSGNVSVLISFEILNISYINQVFLVLMMCSSATGKYICQASLKLQKYGWVNDLFLVIAI